MSAQLQTPPFSFEELLETEEASVDRHEYIGGQIITIQGSALSHSHIIVNLAVAFHGRLRGSNRRGSGIQQRVRTSQTATNWYYPDFLIKCPPYHFHPVNQNSLLNPHAIFEVLSPATETFDRTAKFDEYKLIEELRDYVLVDTARVRVEHFTLLESGDWVLRVYTSLEQELRLEHFEISVPLTEIYEDVEFEEPIVLPQLEIE